MKNILVVGCRKRLHLGDPARSGAGWVPGGGFWQSDKKSRLRRRARFGFPMYKSHHQSVGWVPPNFPSTSCAPARHRRPVIFSSTVSKWLRFFAACARGKILSTHSLSIAGGRILSPNLTEAVLHGSAGVQLGSRLLARSWRPYEAPGCQSCAEICSPRRRNRRRASAPSRSCAATRRSRARSTTSRSSAEAKPPRARRNRSGKISARWRNGGVNVAPLQARF